MKSMKNLLPVLLILFLFVLFNGCAVSEKNEVKQVVRRELDLLKNLDSDTTQKYVSYKELFPGDQDHTVLSSDIQEVFSLFFQGFDYKLLKIHIAGKPKTATVSLRLKTVDARSLAQDYAAALLRRSILLASDTSLQNAKDINVSLEDRYSVLNDLLKENTYETIQTECSMELTRPKKNGPWEIKRTRALENDLVGGLLTYLSDNNILSPEDTMSVYLDTIKSMDKPEMSGYLGIESLLNSDDTVRSLIASALVEQVHQTFNYEITDISRDAYTALVHVTITTFDSDSILEKYRKELEEYLETPEAVIDGSDIRYQKSYQMLLDCINENTAIREAKATFTLINDGVSWKLQDSGQELGDAVFGTLTVSPVSEEDSV